MRVWRPAPFGAVRRFARGATLVRAGEPAHTVYLVRRGEVRISLLTEDGRETTTAVVGPGQIVGISALLGRPIYHAFAEALVPTEAWSLSAERLLRHLPTDRVLLGLVVGALARRLAQEVSLVGEVALLPVGQRVADLQARLASPGAPRPRPALRGGRADRRRRRRAGPHRGRRPGAAARDWAARARGDH